MAVITSGKTFANGEQLSASKLNQVITGATFTQGAIDSGSMQIVGDAISVRDDGITTAKIADSNVTKAKIENVANMKALGNTSGSANSPQEVAILDEDTMSSDSATSLATQHSIKAFVENLIGTADKSSASGLLNQYGGGSQGSITLGGGLIIKFGTVAKNTTSGTAITFQDSSGSASAFPNAIYGVSATSNENIGSGAEVAGVISPTVNGFTLNGYSDNSNAAIGRCFFIAIGY